MSVSVYFDDLHTKVKEELKKSNESVLIAVAWITFSLYLDVFKELIDRGVSVDILCASSQSKRQIDLISELKEYGVNIHLCDMPNQSNHMHHKFAVIDDSVVLNGSFNWSKNAIKSFENLTVISNELEVVGAFLSEFNKIKKLDKFAIKLLQGTVKCREHYCDGEMANIMVFQESPMRCTCEIWGDIISCCSVCGDLNYSVLEEGIQDTYLHNLFTGVELELQDDEIIRFDMKIDSHLVDYSFHGVVIHGIGFVCRELIGRDQENIYTQIIWKNKFVVSSVRDRYETDFGVLYR